MDDIPQQVDVVIQFLVQNRMHEAFNPVLWLIATKAWISTELFLFWTYAVKYDKISFCFHALLFITDCYRTSYDQTGSTIILVLLLISILMTFQTLSFFGTVSLMTVSAIALKPFESFLLLMILKSYWDWIIGYLVCEDQNKFHEEISSRVSDFVYILVFVCSHALYTFSRPQTSSEDLYLIPILMGHIAAFYFRLYTKEYLCIMLAITFVWMLHKSRRFAIIRSILTEY